MNDRSYSVHSCEHGCWVMGRFPPTDEISGLLYTWNRRGLRYCSLAVRQELGALIAVCENSGDEKCWLDELKGEATADAS